MLQIFGFFSLIFLIFFMLLVLVLALSEQKKERFFSTIKANFLNSALKIQYDRGSILKPPSLTILFKPEMELERVDVSLFVVSSGKYSRYYARVIGFSEPGTDFSLEVRSEGITSWLLKKIFNAEDIRIGDPQVDERFVICSNNPSIAVTLFKDPIFKEYMLRISKLRIFKVVGGKSVQIIAETDYKYSDVINAINAMERLLALIAPEIQKKPVTVPKFEFKPEERKLLEKQIRVPSAQEIQKPVTQVRATMEKYKEEFERLRMYVSKIDYIPNESIFNQVILTPWFGDVDQIKYDINDIIHVSAIENRHIRVKEPIKIRIKKVKELKGEYPPLSELQKAVKVESNKEEIVKEIANRYEFLRMIMKIKELRMFTAEYAGYQIKIFLSCGAYVENIYFTFNAIKEFAWTLKLIL